MATTSSSSTLILHNNLFELSHFSEQGKWLVCVIVYLATLFGQFGWHDQSWSSDYNLGK
jgi:hypothetical protein